MVGQGGWREGQIMGRKINVTLTMVIRVDETDWANEYGMDAAEVPVDAPSHLAEYVAEAVRASGLGYLLEQVTVGRTRARVEA